MENYWRWNSPEGKWKLVLQVLPVDSLAKDMDKFLRQYYDGKYEHSHRSSKSQKLRIRSAKSTPTLVHNVCALPRCPSWMSDLVCLHHMPLQDTTLVLFHPYPYESGAQAYKSSRH